MIRDVQSKNPHKVSVSVRADHLHDGRIIPRLIRAGEDERPMPIDKLLDTRRAAATKAGGQGTRYTVRIQGREYYLFCDCGLWFLEV